jgi:ABC-type transporter Mla subunit MlaD
VQTDGVVGPAFVEIVVKGASGPPARSNAVLKAIPTENLTTDELLEKLTQALGKRSCDCGNQQENPPVPAVKKKAQPGSSR